MRNDTAREQRHTGNRQQSESWHPPAKVAKLVDGLREVDAFFRKSGNVIVVLTVREILDEEIARKLA